MSCWAYTNPESDLYPIFGDNPVPICSIVPITPREEGAPLCYMVLGSSLSEEQVRMLGEKLFSIWYPECQTRQEVYDYIRENGAPLRATHFSHVGTDEEKEQFMFAFQEMSKMPDINLKIAPSNAWAILSQIQLATRHPQNTGVTRDMAVLFARQLQNAICPKDSVLHDIAEKGWHPEFDFKDNDDDNWQYDLEERL